MVEGNTDVIALRQAGFEPVVASMGTALTEQHLRELARLTKRLYLCFDADAAGEEATLRGMERAHGQGFEIRVVVLPLGQDPADAPTGFEQRLGQAESYLHYRVRLELERAADRQEAFVRAREILSKAEDSPERQEALRLVADRLDLPRETLSGIAPARGAAAAAGAPSVSQPKKLLDAGSGSSARRSRPSSRIRRCERRSPASARSTSISRSTGGCGPRSWRGCRPTPISSALLAELDATAASEGITRAHGNRDAAPTAGAEAATRPPGRDRPCARDGAAGAPREGAPGAHRAGVARTCVRRGRSARAAGRAGPRAGPGGRTAQVRRGGSAG